MARTVQGRETVYYNSQCVASYRAVLTVDHSTSRIEKLPRATPGFQQPHLKASRHCVKKNIKQKESGHYHSYHACECTQRHRYKMYTTMQAHWASLHPLGCGKKKKHRVNSVSFCPATIMIIGLLALRFLKT